MQRAASSTVDIVMKPKPRERPDWWTREKRRIIEINKKTHPLVVNDYNFFYASIPTEFVIQVPLSAADAEAEDAENAGGVWGLLREENS